MTELEELDFLEHRYTFLKNRYQEERAGSPEKLVIYHLWLDCQQKLDYLNEKQKNKVRTIFLDGWNKILQIKETEAANSVNDLTKACQIGTEIHQIKSLIAHVEHGYSPYTELENYPTLKAIMPKDFQDLIARLRKPRF